MKNSNLIFINEEDVKILFYPLTFTTDLPDLRFGILTIRERWNLFFDNHTSEQSEQIYINPLVIPNQELIQAIQKLPFGQALYDQNDVLISYKNKIQNKIKYTLEITLLENKLSLLTKNNKQFKTDITLLKLELTTLNLSESEGRIYGNQAVFIGQNVILQSVIFNTENGPIYIDNDVKIYGNSVIHGPCYIGKNTTLMPHTFLRNGVSCGENCVLAGEIKNTIIGNNTNKGHYGYLGDSIIGNFCNFGAGTTTSNLKNNFSEIELFDYKIQKLIKSTLTKCGVFMGDFTFTAINTTFYAGTTINPINNVFEHNPKLKFITGCTWGNTSLEKDKLESFITNITLAKNKRLSVEEIEKLRDLYLKLTTNYA